MYGQPVDLFQFYAERQADGLLQGVRHTVWPPHAREALVQLLRR